MKWLPAMLIAVVAGLGPGAAQPLDDRPAPVAYVQAGASDFSITIERDSGRPVAGRDARYTIVVENSADRAQEVTVRASLPPWISGIGADSGGEIGDGYVDWVVTVPPEDSVTLRLRGSYRDPVAEGGPTGTVRVAVTACVVAGEQEHPMVCDTDLADLAETSPLVVWSLVASGAALGLAVALLVRFTARRRQRVAPAT